MFSVAAPSIHKKRLRYNIHEKKAAATSCYGNKHSNLRFRFFFFISVLVVILIVDNANTEIIIVQQQESKPKTSNNNNSTQVDTTTIAANMKFGGSILALLAAVSPVSSTAFTAFVSRQRLAAATAALFPTTTEVFGEASFRLTFKDESGAIISPWHDIPLKRDGDDAHYNMVVEIPKMSKAKMEVATKEENNPIAQDIDKEGKLRDYHGPIYWNYGFLPQTWEDPTNKKEKQHHPELGGAWFGDNDPIDVVEIGSSPLKMGSVTTVKPLGVLAMIDGGELDWKVLAIAIDDADAEKYNDIDEVPEYIKAGIREWFRWYKTPDNKPINQFGYDEKYLDVATTENVIEETHEAWKKLKAGETEAGKLWLGD